MKTQWWVQGLCWLHRKKFGNSIRVWGYIAKDDDSNLISLISATSKHIRFGKDTSDRTSVGGFNQTEMSLMENYLRQALD
jgi:hypothetical protein